MSQRSGVISLGGHSRGFSALLVLLLAGILAVLGGAVWFISDPHANRGAKDRLSPALAALDRVESLPQAAPKSRAEFEGCSTDSGEVFEPDVRRTWTLDLPTDGPAVLISISRSLTAHGWATNQAETKVGYWAHLRMHKGPDLIEVDLVQLGSSVEAVAVVSNHKLCRDLGIFNFIF